MTKSCCTTTPAKTTVMTTMEVRVVPERTTRAIPQEVSKVVHREGVGSMPGAHSLPPQKLLPKSQNQRTLHPHSIRAENRGERDIFHSPAIDAHAFGSCDHSHSTTSPHPLHQRFSSNLGDTLYKTLHRNPILLTPI